MMRGVTAGMTEIEIMTLARSGTRGAGGVRSLWKSVSDIT